MRDRVDWLRFQFETAQHSRNLYREFSIAQMIQEIEELLNTTSNFESKTFNVEIDERVPPALFGDETRIRQVLTNLLENSIEHSTLSKVIKVNVQYSNKRNQI
jgi:signal transduction histidine kinase